MSKLAVLLPLFFVASVCGTALDDYVWRPDPHYNWVDTNRNLTGEETIGEKKIKWTAYELNMTSQKWLTDDVFSPESDAKSIWWHHLYVIVPENVQYKRNATLWITLGKNTEEPITNKNVELKLMATLATRLGMVIGFLRQVPNQYVIFRDDPLQKKRREDAVIAYTWDHFLKDPSQPEWLLYFPMVKASLRAMDTVTDFVKTKFPGEGYDLDSYMVSGMSKRGWTTWDVGAVDKKRVKAIAPIVLDALNFAAVAHHQWRSYGGFSWPLKPYVDMNLSERLDDPNMLLLQQEIDPYFYRKRLTMPKFVINSAMDEFMQPDDTHYWWKEMPGPKWFLLMPNTEHVTATGLMELVPALGTWMDYLLKNRTIPKLDWQISETTGEIVATLDDHGEVHEASMWHSKSCGKNREDKKNRRDFRILTRDKPCLCGLPNIKGFCTNLRSLWSRVKLNETIVDGKRTFRAKVDAPKDGKWAAFIIDVQYKEHKDDMDGNIFPKDKPGRLDFTTEVSIWPNTFPYEDCTGTDCKAIIR